MANLIRSSKSGHDWTINDLMAYNISIVQQNTATFFGQATLPLPAQHPDLLNRLMADEMVDDDSYQVVRYMDLAMDPVPGEESAVGDFAMQLLRMMGYASRTLRRDLRSRKDISLFICREWWHAKTDVCVMDRSSYLLLVQEDKRHLETVDPEPQLIAEAIAAPLDIKIMAGITMTGTAPTFFKIPVTLELIKAVQRGEYPATPTVVAMHRPNVPRPVRRLSEGMHPLDNRCCILSCFEAFRQFVN
ncbi:hypothetical protein PILCRDRAFT_810464 [Piloderma croceum F 1598]|uniref:Uncharacterized protein n=1 Tax=Piloderma croceum (strain F 1598) TaxID=765440 RepID=A0A0C3C0P6_PILCF|nr:hypothetical protein PILCRDRAFT_810464 [Piloderma croceum F 1598]